MNPPNTLSPYILSLSLTGDRYRAVIRRGEGEVDVEWGGTPWRAPRTGTIAGLVTTLTRDEVMAGVEGDGREDG